MNRKNDGVRIGTNSNGDPIYAIKESVMCRITRGLERELIKEIGRKEWDRIWRQSEGRAARKVAR